jgi:fructose-specific phosphotransferase system IIC component
MTARGPDFGHNYFLNIIHTISTASFTLLFPILAGYIAHSISGKPGLLPGFVGGYLCSTIEAGFIGALLTGLAAGYITLGIKQLPVSKYIRPIMPILIIPIITSSLIGFLIIGIIGPPITLFMTNTSIWLHTMGTSNGIILALILGGMIAFDMGGPINKTAFFFAAAMIKENNLAVMGCVAAAIATPAIGMGLATLISQQLWNDEQREAGRAALVMGAMGITEGAIPFGAADPIRTIPCLMLGSMTASALAMWGAINNHAPHGGLIILPIIDAKTWYILSITTGSLITALSANSLKLLRK